MYIEPLQKISTLYRKEETHDYNDDDSMLHNIIIIPTTYCQEIEAQLKCENQSVNWNTKQQYKQYKKNKAVIYRLLLTT